MTQQSPSPTAKPSSSWIPVALSAGFRPGSNIRVFADGNDIALWSSFSGKLSAWVNRCPHRGMRLSHGFVRGEMLACIYHGWHFAQDANCKYIPAHPELVPGEMICAQAHHAHEQDGLLWVSCAEEEPDAPARLPGFGVRSLLIDAPRPVLAGVLEVTHEAQGRWELTLADQPVILGVQDWPEGRTGVHLLTKEAVSAETKKMLSRELEAMRRTCEAIAPVSASASASVPSGPSSRSGDAA
ncbi:MAG: Rieske 2Fe-2S domain-containing protein [Rhodobacteraceae bacterium]|nr:Rieske 2Fe-2S domain-containing protein [Paracoccaceae bacterium]